MPQDYQKSQIDLVEVRKVGRSSPFMKNLLLNSQGQLQAMQVISQVEVAFVAKEIFLVDILEVPSLHAAGYLFIATIFLASGKGTAFKIFAAKDIIQELNVTTAADWGT